MADVSTKLLAQFVENLERDVLRRDVVDLTVDEVPARGRPAARDVAEDEPTTRTSSSPRPSAAGPQPAAAPSGNGAAVRKIDQAEVAPVDLLEMGGSPLLRRLAPLAGFVVASLLVLGGSSGAGSGPTGPAPGPRVPVRDRGRPGALASNPCSIRRGRCSGSTRACRAAATAPSRVERRVPRLRVPGRRVRGHPHRRRTSRSPSGSAGCRPSSRR